MGTTGTITFRRATESDFGLLAHWLAQPHVHRWWHHETSAEAVARDFGPAARGEEPSEDHLVLVDGEPVGLIQRARWYDYPEDVSALAGQVAVPEDAMSVDYFIGDVSRTGHGLGPQVVGAYVALLWRDHPGCRTVLVPVASGNRRSWRTLEKAGFELLAEVELAPDNPVDPPQHRLYRLTRPDG